MTDSKAVPEGTVRVQRDGPRGWHFIAASSFDPAVHVECDEKGVAIGGATGSENQPVPATDGLQALDAGHGWFKVHRDGVLVEGVGSMREADAQTFNALSDEEKEAYVAPKAEAGE